MAQDQKNESTDLPQAKLDSMSYAIGVSISENLEKQGYTGVNFNQVAKGLEEGLEGTGYVAGKDAQILIQRIRKEQMALQFAGKLKISEDFLAENAKKEGVKTTASGLQYKVLKEGSGPKPTASSNVTVHYDGTLIDGTPFDSSRKKGTPFSTPVTSVIKGWIEGLQLMNEGAIYEFYIHPDLAYGVNPRPGVIKPNDALVFNIELISINN